MNIRFTIEDKQEKYKEVINIENVLDKKHFSYVDSDGSNNDIRVFNDGISVVRKDKDHTTYLILRDVSYIKVKTCEGCMKFSIKVVDLKINNDNICIGYCVNDSLKTIKINYLGV